MTEAAYWKIVHERLSPFGVLRRIENRLELGTPDFAYCLKRPNTLSVPASGWIELKHIDAWPARATTAISIPHLTLEQVMWMEEWDKAGGRVWLLMRVRQDHLLLSPLLVRTVHQGGVTRGVLTERASVHGAGRFPLREILACLTQ